MLWIKRNLFLAIGGLVAVALLAVGIVYALGSVSRNAALDEELNQNVATLQRLYGQDPFPATTNIDAARRETDRVRSAVARLQKFFVAPPVERVTGLAFRTYRDNLLAELRRSAQAARTGVPGPTYAFSFEEQRTRVDFDPRTFPLIPEQMADVRAICNVLFEAHVDPLVNIRRARVSGDDEKSSNQSDYHAMHLMTNATTGAVISPYEVTFQCLSGDLATVLQKIALSPYGLVVKSVQVDPIEEAGSGGNTGQGTAAPGGGTAPVRPRRTATPGGAVAPAATPQRAATGDKAVTLLKERRFQATLLIYAVRAVEEPKDPKARR